MANTEYCMTGAIVMVDYEKQQVAFLPVDGKTAMKFEIQAIRDFVNKVPPNDGDKKVAFTVNCAIASWVKSDESLLPEDVLIPCQEFDSSVRKVFKESQEKEDLSEIKQKESK